MVITRKAGLPPLILPSDAGEIAATLAAASTTKAKASGAPGSSHVRVQRGAGTERAIRSASPMALT